MCSSPECNHYLPLSPPPQFYQVSSLSKQLQSPQLLHDKEVQQLKKELNSVAEEKELLCETLKADIAALQAQHEEDISCVGKMSAEAEQWRTELSELREMSSSEMASLQAELAASKSETNTHQMTTSTVCSYNKYG